METHRRSYAWLVLAVLPLTWGCQLYAQEVDQGKAPKLAIVTPGIIVGNEDAATWNRVILLATPRISSGDTSKLNESIRTAVSSLTLTILATVSREASADGTEAYRLDEVGVAYSTTINDKLTTISSLTAARLGAQLDFFGRQMLTENEKQIANLKTVIRTSALTMFDTPAIMLRDGQHKDYVMRHMIWIDPRTGKLALAIWLLSTDRDGRTEVANEPLRVVATGTNEDRKIHVDGRSFFFGIPTSRSFALEDLPHGAKIDWNQAARRLAAHSTYSGSELDELAATLNQMLREAR